MLIRNFAGIIQLLNSLINDEKMSRRSKMVDNPVD